MCGHRPRLLPCRLLLRLRRPPRPVRNLRSHRRRGLQNARAATSSLDQIVSFVEDQSSESTGTLLILDNFEDLAATGALLVRRLLEQAPRLTCLVTSRRDLGLSESVYDVDPLPLPLLLPDEQIACGSERWHAIETNECVALFVDRAKAAWAPFMLSPENAREVADLCVYLDGIPLALELAAAWIEFKTPSQMQADIPRFELLVDRDDPTDPRQAKLRSVLQWSYDKLGGEHQQFFLGLSVFRGGFDVEDAEAVLPDGGTARHLREIRRYGLIMPEGDGAGPKRYRMLETAREFLWDRLTPEQKDDLRRRHATHFTGVATTAKSAIESMEGAAQAQWLHRLEREHFNLLAALDWAEECDVDGGLRLATALWPFWEVRGYWREGQRRTEALLQQSGFPVTDPERGGWDETAASELHARALTNVGALACRQGKYSNAIRYMNAALSLWRLLGDPQEVGRLLGNLGVVALEQGDYSAAAPYLTEAETSQRGISDQIGLAKTLTNRAILAWRQERFTEAWACYEEALSIYRAGKDRNGLASLLNNIGALLKDQGEGVAAKPYFEECREIFERLGSGWQLAYVLTNLGDIASTEGEVILARSYYAESLTRLGKYNDRRAALVCLEGLGGLAAAQGSWENAAWLFGAGAGMRDKLRAPLTPIEKNNYKTVFEEMLVKLGETGYDMAYEAGRKASLEEAVRRALA